MDSNTYSNKSLEVPERPEPPDDLVELAAVVNRLAAGPWPGARPTSWSPGWTAAPPTFPTLAVVGRAHHRAVHEGGGQLTRGPDGRVRATPAAAKPPTVI